jgi:HAD superfamily hydrolase (TIGR01549 family)
MTGTPRPLRAVLLDIGGTVMQPNPSWEHVYALALREFGHEVPIERLYDALRSAYRHGGWGIEAGFEPSEEATYERTVEMDRLALAELGIGDLPDAFYRRLGQLFRITSNWHVYPDVHPALDALAARGLLIGAVSNWVWNLPELLHDLDLVRHFAFVAASARIGYEKPHRRIFEWALEQAKTEAREALHVGDHIDADVAGAAALGIGAVLIDRERRYTADEVPPEVPVIHSLGELLPIVDARITGEAREAAS